MQTYPFRSSIENSDIIKQHSRVALRTNTERIGYVFALIDDDQTALIHFDNAAAMEFFPVADLIPLSSIANEPALYAATLL